MLKTIYEICTNKPILVVFNVTNACNQNCLMCNIPNMQSQNMSFQEIKLKIKEMKSFGIKYVFIQGGEPLLRKDIIDIIDEFIDNGIKPTVITNGILLNRETGSAIACRYCNLAISIDSLIPERYAMLRGSDLNTVKINIEALQGLPKKGNWSITSVISKVSTIDDVKNIMEYAYLNKMMYAIRPYITSCDCTKTSEILCYRYGDIKDIFDFMLEQAKKDNFLASLVYERHIEYIQGKPPSICDAGKHFLYLLANGEYQICYGVNKKYKKLNDFNKAIALENNFIEGCNKNKPCFFNCAREIGILFDNRWKIIKNIFVIYKQMKKYKSFF